MFKINDYVVYSLMGVYKIIDIRKEKDIDNNDTEYYVLQPVYSDNLIIKTPVNNTKVMMRKVMTKDDVLMLIASLSTREDIWINDNKERYEKFKESLRTGNSEQWVNIIKTIHLKKQEKNVNGKKLTKLDEEIMEAAERNLNEEFATALNISPDEVISYIKEHVS